MNSDITAIRAELAAQRVTAERLLEASLDAANGEPNRHSFIRRFDAMARAAARSVDIQHATGAPLPPFNRVNAEPSCR